MENFTEAQNNLVGLKNVHILNNGVSDTNKTVFFDNMGTSGSKIIEESSAGLGQNQIDVVSIDELLGDKPTFIKMDIEGAEKDALMGAENVIRKNKPILAICIYHEPGDFWKIPEIIHNANAYYKFYVRQYKTGNSETVLYAI